MIRIRSGEPVEGLLQPLEYARGRSGIGRLVLRFTRWARARAAARYMVRCEHHLDIGCGDGYFLRRAPARERYGIDKLLGDELGERLDFQDATLDCVTMLAVIEHLKSPERTLGEIHRVLKPGGCLVITTPKAAAEPLIRLYMVEIEEEHESYFDLASIERLTRGLFEMAAHHTFLLGLNQAFCLRKPASNPDRVSPTADPLADPAGRRSS